MSTAPVARPRSADLPVELPGRSRRSAPAARTAPRVLLVDDEPNVLGGLRRMMQGHWSVDTAIGATAAAALLATCRYDAVLTDYDMPGYDGIWLLEQVRRVYPATLRVLVSGSGEDLFAPHVRSGLVQRFVAKPAGRELLLGCLR